MGSLQLSAVEGGYISLTMPGDDAEDTRIGLGFSFNVWNGLHIEPNYSMSTEENDDGDREGTFNLGLGYRF